jgi:metal-responsive CopG/Arc/MetJ family transcriptional regulator
VRGWAVPAEANNQGEQTMSKKILVALPPNLLARVDFAAKAECRTRSDLVREALRRYVENFQRSHLIGVNSAATVSILEDAYSAPAAR